jgi:16S rRNA (guanine(966)-N(2))-methyltransferase RsmD
LRVIAGKFRGTKLRDFSVAGVRPYTDRIKESIFSTLQFSLPDAVVADVFCGSGSAGIEALSRGAKFVAFNDLSASALRLLQENLQRCHVDTNSYSICQMPADEWLRTTSIEPQIVFLDPPFTDREWAGLWQAILANQAIHGAHFVARRESQNEVLLQAEFVCRKSRKMGRSTVDYIEVKAR